MRSEQWMQIRPCQIEHNYIRMFLQNHRINVILSEAKNLGSFLNR
jgi:hypothetical protein